MVADWSVYLVRTRLDTLYTGIATDVERRVAEHAAGGMKCARYLRSKGPLRLEYEVLIGDRALAMQAEHRIKKLDRREKESLLLDRPGRDALLRRLGIPPGTE